MPGEIQRALQLSTAEEQAEALRRNLRSWGVSERQVLALGLLVEHGRRFEAQGEARVELQIDKRRAGESIGCGPNRFVRGITDWEAAGIVHVDRTTKSWTYTANLTWLATYEPPGNGAQNRGDWSALVQRGPPWSSLVQPGPRAPVPEIHEYKIPAHPDPDPEGGSGGKRTNVDHGGPQRTGVDQRVRPGRRHHGVDDALLVEAVQSGDLGPLRRVWDCWLAEGWVKDCEEHKLQFLTICHHAATSAGINRSRVGVVVSRVKHKIHGSLDTRRIRHESQDWAEEVLARRRASRGAACTNGAG